MGEIAINPIHNVHKKYRTMNLVNPYIFAPPVDLTTNTEIGGVAVTISTPALLATKLGIDVSRITNFSIVGSDIKCRITGTYSTSNYFNYGTNNTTTYYLDNDGLITDVGYVRGYPVLKQFYHPNATSVGSGYYGRECAILNIAYFPKLTSCVGTEFYGFMEGKQAGLKCRIYIPLCTTMVTPTTGQVFSGDGVNSNTTIYCHPSLATNNGGAPDNDIAYAISRGATVRYVTNFTAPLTPTLTSIGTIYNTAVQLVDAGGSTNAIDYYEVTVNGTPYGNVNVGLYITGLTPNTSYNITLKAVDIFYNKSAVSNSLSATTDNETWDISTGLISYYKLESSSVDSYGSNKGSDTSMSYAAGKIGNAAVFSGSGYIQGTPILGYTSFTISCWIKTTENGERIIFSNRAGTSAIIQMAINSGKLVTRIRSSASTGITTFSSISNVNTNTWRHVAMVFDKTSGLQKNYIDGFLENSIAYTGGSFSGFTRSSIGVDANDLSYGKFIGSIDEVAIYNEALTNEQMMLLYNAGIGITL